MTGSRHRGAGRLSCVLLLALVVHLPAPTRAASSRAPARTGTAADTTPAMAQSAPRAVQPSPLPAPPTVRPSPLPTPGPIVPRGNPVGKVGVVAMVVAALAGLWIYRVIRKGL